ncbi:hypothetical protein J2P12_09180 [Candidatus Bathyarchaeota archaeon]|nr:hypothetical protein [Candidatus Bathyarchaeota archaeon]
MKEDIEELLFNLANNDRLTLLAKISEQRQRLTSLAKAINASNQECSRHLNRLSDAGYIKKDSNGLFETTTLGKAVLRVLPSMQFLLIHRNYFLSHDLTSIPHSFNERIGELINGKLVGHFNTVLDHIKKVILEGREFVWLIADQPVVPTSTIGNAFTSRKVPVRLIIKQGTDMKALSAAKSILPQEFEVANLAEVGVAMAINEHLAGVCFSGVDGKIDFGVGFVGSEPPFRTWCRDLFDHYWNSAEPVRF